MDSGNSSSMQSSSGGDDQEYDSRSFFPNNINIAPPPPPPPMPPPPPLNNPQLLFNDHHPGGGYLQAFSDRDLFTWPPPPPPPPPANILRSEPATAQPNPNQGINYLNFSGEFSAPAAAEGITAPPPQSAAAAKAGPSKNPKKRTRASRRAPTTVLTTDTSNFRAMVQEFTGIPDPPFSAAASVYSRRLDLLGTAGSSMRLAAALGSGGASGLLRPTAQRLPPSNNATIQDVIGQTGPGQPDPFLSFQTLHQLGYQPQPSNAPFGINIGLLRSENNLSNTIGSESQHHHENNNDDNNNNNNYVMSCGAMTSSLSTDLIRPQGEYRNQ